MAPPNPTGFDVKKYVDASKYGNAWTQKDPWARYEAWRYNGPFSRFNRFRGALPGLGIATVAFAGYCAFEWAFLTDNHGHDSGHGDSHH